jgi:hypothetical protein
MRSKIKYGRNTLILVARRLHSDLGSQNNYACKSPPRRRRRRRKRGHRAASAGPRQARPTGAPCPSTCLARRSSSSRRQRPARAVAAIFTSSARSAASSSTSFPPSFGQDTTLPVLDPGRGRTKTGRLWGYARDDRPWQGGAPPAVAYVYSADRSYAHPIAHLAKFSGVLQVDAFQGFDRLASSARTATSFSHIAGRIFAAGSSTCRKRPARRSPPRHCSASPHSMPSRPRSIVKPPRNASSFAKKRAVPSSRRSSLGCKSSLAASPVRVSLPKPCATRSPAGRA